MNVGKASGNNDCLLSPFNEKTQYDDDSDSTNKLPQ